LVCHKWDREQGRWRIAKRAGAELFLFYAAQLYEVVVFSHLPQHEGDAIVKKLDPFGCISHSLYRFATKHRHGVFLKDISHLNRDPAKVIVMGHDTKGFSPHPENMIGMRQWEGDSVDGDLEASIDFLEMLAFSKLQDVRPVIKHYREKTFPDDFDAAQEEAFLAAKEAQKGSLQSRVGTMFSLKKEKSTADSSSYTIRKQERMEARRMEYARIRALMQKQLEAEMQKEKEYYAEHKMALWDIFSKGPPPSAGANKSN